MEFDNDELVNEVDEETRLRMENEEDGVRGPPSSISDFFLLNGGENGVVFRLWRFAAADDDNGIGIDLVLTEDGAKLVSLGGFGNINTFLNRWDEFGTEFEIDDNDVEEGEGAIAIGDCFILYPKSFLSDAVINRLVGVPDFDDVLGFLEFLFLMTSVFKDNGLEVPWSLRNKPHALHKVLPRASLLQSGVAVVLQL